MVKKLQKKTFSKQRSKNAYPNRMLRWLSFQLWVIRILYIHYLTPKENKKIMSIVINGDNKFAQLVSHLPQEDQFRALKCDQHIHKNN